MYETKLCNFDAKKKLAQMDYGKKKPFFAGKLNLNHKKGSCAQMGYGQK